MLTHVVLMKFHDRSPEHLARVRNMLTALPARISEIRYYEVGVNVIQSERAYDLALYSRFDSLADLKTYQAHPEHVPVAQYLAAAAASIVAVDYETG